MLWLDELRVARAECFGCRSHGRCDLAGYCDLSERCSDADSTGLLCGAVLRGHGTDGERDAPPFALIGCGARQVYYDATYRTLDTSAEFEQPLTQSRYLRARQGGAGCAPVLSMTSIRADSRGGYLPRPRPIAYGTEPTGDRRTNFS